MQYKREKNSYFCIEGPPESLKQNPGLDLGLDLQLKLEFIREMVPYSVLYLVLHSVFHWMYHLGIGWKW